MKNNKGFTLLEMLIVIGCIVALVAIAYPSFSQYQEKNRENADVVAMHSAEALFTTAYNTGKIIEGRPATEAVATKPLYYDGNGNLTWKPPTPYGKGTAKDSGVVISCCDDYEYDSAKDYRGGYIYCYYTPEGGDHPGFHIHWMSAGGDIGGNTPVLPEKPDKPVFPEKDNPSGGGGGNTGGSTGGGDTGGGEETPDTPEEPKKEWTVKEILSTGHPYPTTKELSSWNYWTDDFPVVAGHRYVYKGQVYISGVTVQDGKKANYNDGAVSPDGYAWAQAYFVVPNDRILTSKKNVDENGNLVVDNTQKDQYGNYNGQVDVEPGNIFIQYNDDGTVDYYVRWWGASAGVSPLRDSNNWIRLCRPGECADCDDIHISG